MKVRVILVCTLFLLAAAPSFARPVCAECVNNKCANIAGSIEECIDWTGTCRTEPDPCSPPRTSTVLAEWKVASIEISRPSLESITVTAPAVAAKAEVPTPEPAQQK